MIQGSKIKRIATDLIKESSREYSDICEESKVLPDNIDETSELLNTNEINMPLCKKMHSNLRRLKGKISSYDLGFHNFYRSLNSEQNEKEPSSPQFYLRENEISNKNGANNLQLELKNSTKLTNKSSSYEFAKTGMNGMPSLILKDDKMKQSRNQD